MTILDGKTLSEQILTSLKSEISDQKLSPTLDIILVGTDPASQKYVDMKQKVATDIGIGGQVHHLDQSASTAEVIDLINRLNQDKTVTGFMVQLPLPPQIDTQQVLSAIDPKKDADGLSPFNLGLIFQKQSTGIPAATALGITKILDHYHIDVSGKNAVIVGRSPDVAFPLFALLTARDATVTICHTQTKNLNDLCRQADILVSAIGKAKFFDKTFVKPGAVVIDVGFSRDQNGKLSGDFNFNSIKDIASFITPVPGGVGPMTIASLLFNTVQIAKKTKNETVFHQSQKISLNKTRSFIREGFRGFDYGDSTMFIEVHGDHPLKRIDSGKRTYIAAYILENSKFVLDDQIYSVKKGDKFIINPGSKYKYTGKMILIEQNEPGTKDSKLEK